MSMLTSPTKRAPASTGTDTMLCFSTFLPIHLSTTTDSTVHSLHPSTARTCLPTHRRFEQLSSPSSSSSPPSSASSHSSSSLQPVRSTAPIPSNSQSQSQLSSSPSSSPSRRSFLSLLVSAGVLFSYDRKALADAVTSQLTAYRDLPKGFTILRPNGWNEFEGLQDNYDIKWQDVIQPLEFITVLTTPVSTDKKLSNLGTVDDVGSKLAKSRNAQLVSAVERAIDGVPAFVFEMKREQSHQITLLCISKMKLYSVNASSSERRWSKREKLLRAVVNSFKPKL